MECGVAQDDIENIMINDKTKNDIGNKKPSLLLFYKSLSIPFTCNYTNKLDYIIAQKGIEKRGKCTQLTIKSHWLKDNSIEFAQRNNKINCLKDINFSVWATISKDIPKWTEIKSFIDSYFNLIDLTSFYPSLELVKPSFSPDLQEILFKIVTLSKNHPEISRAASNAISILNKLGYSLNNKDLQSVNIPYSDLSYSLIIGTNFQNSNLSSANFSQSNLYQVNFKNCDLENAKFSSHKPIINYDKIGSTFCISSCGIYLAAFWKENEGVIRIWEISSEKLIKEIPSGDVKHLHLLQFSPSGRYLSTIKLGIFTLYDLQDDCRKIVFKRFDKYAYCFAFSSCETYIAVGSQDNSITILYLKSQKLAHYLCGHSSKVVSMCFSPCNKFLYSAGYDSYILIWAVEAKNITVPCYKENKFLYNKVKKAKRLVKRFEEEGKLIKSIAPINNGKFIICTSSSQISIWSIHLGEKIYLYTISSELSFSSFNFINLLTFRAAGGEILVFDIEAQEFIYQTYCQPGKASNQVVFLPNKNSIAAVNEGKGILFFDISDRKYIKKSNCVVNSIAFSPCGKYFTTHCGEAEIVLWDLALYKEIKLFNGREINPNNAIKVIIYSPYGNYMVTPYNNSIFIFSPYLDVLYRLKCVSIQISALAISHDEKLIAAGDFHNIITLWRVENPSGSILKICSLNETYTHIKYLGFTKDSEMLISCTDNYKIKIWCYQEMKCTKVFNRLGESNVLLDVSLCHWLMAYTSKASTQIFFYDLILNLWDNETLKSDATEPYTSLKFSPHGNYIAALSTKSINGRTIHEIYIWHVESKQLLRCLKESAGLVASYEFSYSENIIAVVSENCIIKFWDWNNNRNL